MTACQGCIYAESTKAGKECPIRKFNAGMSAQFAAGCNLRRVDKPQVGPVDSPHALSRPEPVIYANSLAKDEKILQALCEKELSRRGIEYLHMSIRAREKKGWIDLTLAIRGRAIGIELKRDDGKLSADQVKCHERLRANGWTVVVCRSYEQFRHFIEEMSQ